MCMCLPPGCGKFVGEDCEAKQESLWLEAGIETMACAPYWMFVEFGDFAVSRRCMRFPVDVERESGDGRSVARG